MAISMTIQPITLAAPRSKEALETIYEEQDIRWFREGDKDPCKKSGSTGDISGNSNQEKIWNFLTGSGLSAEQAAGIMGNIQAESGFSPTRHEASQGWEFGGWGLAQWTFGRRTAIVSKLPEELKKYHSQEYGGPTDENGVLSSIPIEDNDKLLKFELEYLIQESNSRPVTAAGFPGSASTEWDRLKEQTTLENATVFWHNNFEVSADSPSRVMEVRGRFAQAAYDKFKDSSGSSSSSSTLERIVSISNPDSSSKITFLGDSITVGMKSDLTSTFSESNVEAEVGKGISWLNSRIDSGITLNDVVVINIGTNDNFPVDQAKTMLDKLKDKKVYLVNNFGKGGNVNFELVNRNIAEISKGYSNVKVLDWKAEVEKKAKADGVSDRDFYKEDGYHINETKGKELYIQFLKDSLKGIGDGESEECASSSSADGSLSEYVLKYAWPETPKRTDKKPEYAEAITKAKSEGRYVGDSCFGGGVDCGGFVTTILHDSGFEPRYNHNGKLSEGANATSTQRAWAEANWQNLGTGGSVNVNDLKPGDVAHSPGHTFVYVGHIDGFATEIASASQCETAPKAGMESLVSESVTWFRKK